MHGSKVLVAALVTRTGGIATASRLRPDAIPDCAANSALPRHLIDDFHLVDRCLCCNRARCSRE